MLADVTDEMELVTGKRQEGILYSAFSFAQKMTFGIGTAIASLSLILIAFPKQSEPSAIPPEAVNGLASVSALTPVILGLIAMWAFQKYTLSRNRLIDIQLEIGEKNAT